MVRNPLPLVYEGQEIPRTTILAGDTITVAGQEAPRAHADGPLHSNLGDAGMEAAALAIAACLLATCIPLRRISRLSIVDSIETVECLPVHTLRQGGQQFIVSRFPGKGGV